MDTQNGADPHDGARDRSRRIIAAALLAPIALLLLAAVVTWRAERRYATVTRSAVHALTSIAAWQYARRANMALQEEAMNAFMANGCPMCEAMRRDPGTPFRPRTPESLLTGVNNGSAQQLKNTRLAFTFTTPDSTLAVCCVAADTATRALIWRAIQRFRPNSPDDAYRVLFDATAPHRAVALLSVFPAHTPRRVVYGLVADAEVFRDRLGAIASSGTLLPGLTLGRQLEPEEIGVRISAQDEHPIYAFGRAPGPTAGVDSIGLSRSELRVTLDLSPRLASAVLGGAPSSQMPALLLTIVVAAVLAVVGLNHERKGRELARLRGRFVANVSHELRTPLAQISMFAETLELGRERGPTEGRQFAALIRSEARRMTALVENVLRFSRLESGRHSLRFESHDILEQVRAASEAFTPIARAADVVVRVDGNDAGGARASVDPAAFRQVILNLLDNAVKHGGRGARVAVRVCRVADAVHVVVEDSGPGVPVEWRQRVFEPYVRVEETAAAGAGIGLAVVRDLISAHGGRVWIDESPLGGARVTATFPAQIGARQRTEAAQS